MKKYLSKSLPVILAGILQIVPMLKTVFLEAQAIAPSGWAIVFRLGTGAVAFLGYHAVSSASSIAISPVNATNGTPYVGTVTYSGSHAGSVSSMTLTNLCLTTARTLVPGLTIVYSGLNKATVSGTPTATGTFPFTLKMWDGGCSSGLSDSRSTTLVIGAAGGGNVAPSMVAAPQSVTAQIGSDVLFSAGASGTPVPRYYWYIGVPSPSTLIATNSSFAFNNVQLSNAGLYTVTASNVAGQISTSAFLSVCRTAGSNILGFHYTNYATVSNLILMNSFITNVPAGSNSYKWQYNYVDITPYTTNGSNLTLAANSVYAGHSGIYSVVFNGFVGSTVVVNQQAYDSYWAFGTPAVVNASPQSTNVLEGSNVALTTSANVQQNPYGTNLLLGFFWYLNGTNLISSQSNTGTNVTASLFLTNAKASDAGTYTVVVTNYWGSVTSAPAVLTVTIPPAIISQPQSKSALVGQTVNFNVAATGTAPLSYQWRNGSVPISNDSVFSGATSNILTLTGLQISNSGSYSVVITNVGGSVTSSNASLTVLSPPIVSLIPNGQFVQLNANLATGLTYIVQTATTLSNNQIWVPIITNMVAHEGMILFTNSSSNAQQFFRLSFP